MKKILKVMVLMMILCTFFVTPVFAGFDTNIDEGDSGGSGGNSVPGGFTWSRTGFLLYICNDSGKQKTQPKLCFCGCCELSPFCKCMFDYLNDYFLHTRC